MKKYINRFISGAMMLLAVSALFSCEDEDDLDMAYNRNFQPISLDVSAEATTAEITWKSTPNTSHYVLELSLDSLYDGCSSENSLLFGEDGSIKSTSLSVENLYSASYYFVRVKSVAKDDTPDSKWMYYKKNTYRSFKTKSENILNAVGTDDKGEDFIILRWTISPSVTHIQYTPVIGMDENNNPILGETKTVTLNDENITEGNVTITGLKASTSYQFTIYNNDHARGTRTATTRIQIPEANLVVRINAGATLTQEMLDSWAEEESVTVRFEEGAEYTLVGVDPATGDPAGLTIPSNLSITFFGAEGSEKAILKIAREIVMGGTHAYVRFINLTINDGGAQYLFNQGVDATATEISFKDCDINNFTRSVIRFKDEKSISSDLLSFENCIISNQGSGSYACITLDSKAYTVSNIEFTNTTFNTLQHNLIALNHSSRGLAAVNAINFNNCTFYNYVGSTRYLVDAGSDSQGPTVTLRNTILAKTFTAALADGIWSSTSKGIRTKAVNVYDTYMTIDGVFSSNAIKNCLNYAGTSEELFTDPVKGNFTIKDRNFPEGIGDKRWYAE
ncbi:DUF5123 domain-containing protein [Bacteroides nordii]|uniref:DUF5123 domain-containing protein n=1 Tax=Bacteroides nordii TaxID=291645 RepID=UPI003522CD16